MAVLKKGNWIPNLSGSFLFSGEFLALFAFIVYLRTLAPGVWGFDSAEFATGAYTLGIVHPPGYPIYLILAKVFTLVFPVNDIAYRLNVFSAIFAALTVYVLYKTIILLTKNRIVAWVSAGFFAFSNYFWQMGLVTEVYTLHTFFLAACLYLILRYTDTGDAKWLYAFVFVYGLSLCNHTSGVLFSFGFLWLIVTSGFLMANWRRKAVIALICFLTGLLPYLYFPIRFQADIPLNYARQFYGIDLSQLQGIWWMVSGKAYGYFSFAYPLNELPVEFVRYFGFLWRNFLGIGVLLGVLGFVYLLRKNKNLAVGLLLIFTANAVFFINYRVIDKDTMFLPSFLVFTIFLAYGVLQLIQLIETQVENKQLLPVFGSLSIAFFSLIPLSALALNWQWVDMHKMDGPQEFARKVFLNIPQGSMVFADWSSAVVLEYFQVVQGERPDLLIYNRSRVGAAQYYFNWLKGLSYQENNALILQHEMNEIDKQSRQVYLVEYEPAFETAYRFIPEGDYFRLAPK